MEEVDGQLVLIDLDELDFIFGFAEAVVDVVAVEGAGVGALDL